MHGVLSLQLDGLERPRRFRYLQPILENTRTCVSLGRKTQTCCTDRLRINEFNVWYTNGKGGLTLGRRTFASEFAGEGKASREGVCRDALLVVRVSIHSRR